MSEPAEFVVENDIPPPYTIYADTLDPNSRPSSSLFSSQLASLRTQIASDQAARSNARQEQDAKTLSLLIPHIEDLLSSIAGIHPTPRLVEAILVPDQAVESSWQLSDEVEERPGEVRRVIHVGPPQKSKDPESDLFTGTPTTATLLWWSDGSMTRRLAKLLQPQQQPAVSHHQTVTQQGGSRQKRGNRWGFITSKKANATSQPDDGVSMTVKAEETTFRKENEFGIWETCTGWGLVIRIRIRRV